ncbi:MAG: DUF1801 domain-containing protein, partial [Nitrospira sp.]|nr:DUF1801 domain-containing protein [Nitrospira sp.]
MSDLFRLSGTKKRDPGVEAWFKEHLGPLGSLASNWFEEIRRSGQDVREVLHDGWPTACIGDVAFAYVAVFREHVNVGFFRGAELADPTGMLEGTGRLMRHVKLRPAREVDTKALQKLLASAYVHIKGRIHAAHSQSGVAGGKENAEPSAPGYGGSRPHSK